MIPAYRHIVSVPKLFFAVLIALAVLLAPALSRSGAAFAAVPDHHAQMMQSGHCKAAPSSVGEMDKSSDMTKSAGKNCCMATCMAVAITPGAPQKPVALHGSSATFSLTTQYRDCIAEIATPPPRLA